MLLNTAINLLPVPLPVIKEDDLLEHCTALTDGFRHTQTHRHLIILVWPYIEKVFASFGDPFRGSL